MSTLRLVLKNKSLMKKIGFTVLAFLFYRICVYIPVPMINVSASVFDTDLLGFINSFSGGALKNVSIVALGVSPYITASIVTQVLQMDIVPILKEWSEEGETGRKKINRFNKYLGIILGFIQALAMTAGISYLSVGVSESLFTFVYLALIMTAGTAFLTWMGDQITANGVGNGLSMIIAAGIISGMPATFRSLWSTFIDTTERTNGMIGKFIIVVVLYILVILGVTLMQTVTRKIPIQYSNRQVSLKGKNDSNIPVRVNSAGVMPVIFAITLMSLPLTIIQYSGINNTLTYWLTQIFDTSKPIGIILYIVLIFIFTIYYSFITVNPEKIAENLSKQNAYIPGVRPGEDTEVFVSKVVFKVTLLGALYLSILAILPIACQLIFSLPSSVRIGGTSIIIVVGVGIETFRQIATEAKKTEYRGFIR